MPSPEPIGDRGARALWRRYRRALWPELRYGAVAVTGAAAVGVVLAVGALVRAC